ncbi:MAG: response regulator [Oligoflexales bacterium]
MPSSVTVLIVDDHPDFRWLMTHVLRQEGFHCHEACCAEEALLRLASDCRPDIIVTDLHMREMSGRDLLVWIRGTKYLDQVPVLLVSNDVLAEAIARNAGFDSFVDKPHLARELPAKVRALLSGRGLSN